jgi:hypothetical protein
MFPGLYFRAFGAVAKLVVFVGVLVAAAVFAQAVGVPVAGALSGAVDWVFAQAQSIVFDQLSPF